LDEELDFTHIKMILKDMPSTIIFKSIYDNQQNTASAALDYLHGFIGKTETGSLIEFRI